MDHVTFLRRPPLARPPFVCAFRGWNDGGEAASVAAEYLIQRWDAQVFAHVDPEEFYDFQVSRPTVRLEGGVSRVIDWPAGELRAASPSGHDVVLFTAAEPNVRWRTFATVLLDCIRDLQSPLVVTMGAFLTDVPHTRPVPVVGSAENEDVARRMELSRSQYEGPTGIVGVLHDLSNRSGIPSVSLWAAIPHYLPSAPNPKAALALVSRSSAVLGIPIDTEQLEEAASRWEEGVNRLVEDSRELTEYVERLEEAADRADDLRIRPAGEPVPSGDAIAAEVERFLREQNEK